MNKAATPLSPQAYAPEFARQIDAVLNMLLVLIAARFRILGRWTVPVWGRVARARQRLLRLMAHLAAGPLPPARPRLRRPTPSRPKPYVPMIHRWLARRLGWEANGSASQLEHLLNRPETIALLAAAPSAARTLRPICRLLGITPPALDLPKPTPRPTRKPATHLTPPPESPIPTPPEPPTPALVSKTP